MAPPAAPRFRRDLIASRRETADGDSFIYKDPVHGRYFRLREPEHLIASRLDGATLPETLAARLQAESELRVSPASIRRFIDRLGRLGLLETEQHDSVPGSGARSRLQGGLLHLRLPLVDPDRLLERLARWLAWVFTPMFVLASLATIGLALPTTIAHAPEIARDLRRLFSLDVLLVAWLTLLVVAALHELAHGVTCRRFGGRVNEMGFMLLYFHPALYCNVSDAWLIPERSRRLWVTFAGAYFEVLLWALATLVWRVTDPASSVNHLALIVMATSGIKTFFNLNPLIKLDGYYLLSDALDIPNLRQKAFVALRRRIGLASGAPGVVDPSRASRRERRILLTYGVLAGAYSAWFLGLVIWHVGGHFVSRYQVLGFLAFTGLVASATSPPLRRVLTRVPDEAPRRRRPRWRRPFVALLGLALLPVLLVVRLPLKVTGELRLHGHSNADLRAEVDGILAEVYRDEGAEVRQGEPIARLSDIDYRTDLLRLEAALEAGRARLQMLRAGATPQEISVARAGVAKARARLKFSSKDLERSRSLLAAGLLSRKQAEEIEAQAAVQRNELDEARAELAVLTAGGRAEEVAAAEADLERLEAERDQVRDRIGRLLVVSPHAGIVTTRSLESRLGEFFERGELIAEVQALDRVEAEIEVGERDIAEVRVGQPVAIKAGAFPGRTFQGRVMGIAPMATEDETLGKNVFRVTTEIDNAELLLRPGMMGYAKIRCDRKSLLDLATRRIARVLRVEFWSWW